MPELYAKRLSSSDPDAGLLDEMILRCKRAHRELIESLPIGVFELDLQGKFTYANKRALELSGYTEKDLEMGLHALQMFVPEERERVAQNIQRVVKGENLGKNVYRALRKDGSPFLAEVHSTCIINEDGGGMGLRGVFEDITLRTEVEAALKESEEKWRSLVVTAPVIILTLRRDGTILFLNRTVGDHTPESSIGSSAYDYVPPASRDKMRKSVEHVFRTGKPTAYEIQGDGEHGPGTAWYQSFVGPIISGGEVSAVTLVSVDITERRKMEDALKANKKALERKNIALREVVAQIEVERNKLKEDILGNVSEILLPLLDKIKVSRDSRKYAVLLKRNLAQMTASFGRKISDRRLRLSPREIEICNMIKEGMASKEISGVLGVSCQTVEKHRKNIRDKLRLTKKKINLTSYLQQLS